MSGCIKELFDYNLVKKCCKCKTIRSKNFLVEINIEKMVYIHNANPAEINIMMSIERTAKITN